MRVLLLYSSPWWNAAAEYAVTLGQWLGEEGHCVTFAGDPGTPAYDRALRAGVRCCPVWLRRGGVVGLARTACRLRQVLRTDGVEVINAHSPQGHVAAALMAAWRGRRIPLVRTRCEDRPPQRHPGNAWLYRSATQALVLPSAAHAERLRVCLGHRLPPVTVVHSALDVDAWRTGLGTADWRREHGVLPEMVVIGILARLSPEKGHGHFLRVVARVAAQCPEARFLISGEAFQVSHQDLREQAAALGIGDRVLLRNRWADAREGLAGIDIGVITSRFSESICRIAMEYMAAGIPIVTVDVNVLPEMVDHEVTGLVFGRDDVHGMADGITRLVRDRALRARMGQAGLARLRDRFHRARHIKETLQVYNAARGGV